MRAAIIHVMAYYGPTLSGPTLSVPGERKVRDYAAGFDYTKISIDIYILADALNLITFEWLAILRLVCAG